MNNSKAPDDRERMSQITGTAFLRKVASVMEVLDQKKESPCAGRVLDWLMARPVLEVRHLAQLCCQSSYCLIKTNTMLV